MKILLLGHSLIEFGDWVRLLPGNLTVNLGRAGETTAGLLGRLDGAIRGHLDADALAVMSGANDLLAGDDSFLHEYRRIARRLRKAYPAARIVLHGVLPISPDWVAPAAVAVANARIAQIATESGVTLLDLAAAFGDGAGLPRPRLYDADGVHLSAEGYRVWAAALLDAIGASGPRAAPATAPTARPG